MKYVIGSLIISFGILFIAVLIMMSMNVQATGNVLQHLSIAWAVLTVITYPLAKKIIR